jgi:hypothetical protein
MTAIITAFQCSNAQLNTLRLAAERPVTTSDAEYHRLSGLLRRKCLKRTGSDTWEITDFGREVLSAPRLAQAQ